MASTDDDDDRSRSLSLVRGSVLNGRYELIERIGQGGIGTVWAAKDRASKNGQIVAVKMLRSAKRGSILDARFAREGEILARVRSPHVCRMFSAEIDRDHDGTRFLVVERLVGMPLDKALPRRKRLPFEEARLYTEHVLRGLAAAHAEGIVHRDLKPQNIFLANDSLLGSPGSPSEPLLLEQSKSKSKSKSNRSQGAPLRCGGPFRAVLIDFGVGKFLDNSDFADGSEGLTSTIATVGSPRYMAPEQLGGSRTADERCDVYAAATVAFRMLTGSLPFDSDKPTNELALKTTYAAPSLADRTGETWPEALEHFLAWCLQKNPADRPRTGSHALDAWLDANADVGVTARHRIDARQREHDGDGGEGGAIEIDETPVMSRRRRT